MPHDFWFGVLVIAALFLCLPSGRRRAYRGGWQPRSDGRELSFDEQFPAQPSVVRRGVVIARRELAAAQWTLSAAKRPNPPTVPHYSFRIECNDEKGSEEIIVLVEKNEQSVLAEEGLPVVVTMTPHRMDYGHIIKTVVLA